MPAHFPKDEAGLGYFDGSHLYEHADPKQAEQPDWNTFVFNYGRNEVQNFLISNALFWFDKYHLDGLRVDAVASMLYLDYGKREGQWIPNRYGGKENIEAIHFLRTVNEHVYEAFPDAMMIAEESTAWPQVSRPTYLGGLGFGFKWNMGWMHDMLNYMSQDPGLPQLSSQPDHFQPGLCISAKILSCLFRTMRSSTAKAPCCAKCQATNGRNLQTCACSMVSCSGIREKSFCSWATNSGNGRSGIMTSSLEWHLLKEPLHAGLQRWVRDLNTLYRGKTALHEFDFDAAGFEWVDCKDSQRSIISFLRRGPAAGDQILFVCNFTPVVRAELPRWRSPAGGTWKEILNSDAPLYGGSGQGNLGGLSTIPLPIHGRPYTLNMTLPPLGVLVFQPDSGSAR